MSNENNSLAGVYTRLELPNAMVTPQEVLLLLRDFNRRFKDLENNNEKQRKDSKSRVKSDKTS